MPVAGPRRRARRQRGGEDRPDPQLGRFASHDSDCDTSAVPAPDSDVRNVTVRPRSSSLPASLVGRSIPDMDLRSHRLLVRRRLARPPGARGARRVVGVGRPAVGGRQSAPCTPRTRRQKRGRGRRPRPASPQLRGPGELRRQSGLEAASTVARLTRLVDQRRLAARPPALAGGHVWPRRELSPSAQSTSSRRGVWGDSRADVVTLAAPCASRCGRAARCRAV